MTLMMPHYVPAETTVSEKEVFELIKNAPDSADYVCLHSLGIARHKRKEYAKTDFVLLGPPGLFCLEVKGGNIYRNGGVWEIGWPGKTYVSSEGPFKQAQSARWALIDYLKQHLKFDVRKQIVFGWGVIFQNVIFNMQDPEWDNKVIYDQRDKTESFVRYSERLGQNFRMRLTRLGDRVSSKRWSSFWTWQPTGGWQRVWACKLRVPRIY
jgi:hypothetical protein